MTTSRSYYKTLHSIFSESGADVRITTPWASLQVSHVDCYSQDTWLAIMSDRHLYSPSLLYKRTNSWGSLATTRRCYWWTLKGDLHGRQKEMNKIILWHIGTLHTKGMSPGDVTNGPDYRYFEFFLRFPAGLRGNANAFKWNFLELYLSR